MEHITKIMASDKTYLHALYDVLTSVAALNTNLDKEHLSVIEIENLLKQIPFIDYICVLKPKKYCVYFSDRAARFLGHDAQEMLGSQFWISKLHSADKLITLNKIEKNIESGEGAVEYRIETSQSTPVWILDQHKVVHINESQAYIVGTWFDITHLKNKNVSVENTVDSLTGLLNRQGIQQRINELVEAEHHGTQYFLCHLDLDEFKIINNNHGQLSGDELLRQIASLLKDCLRCQSTLSRLNGDAFVFLLENCTIEQASKTLEQVQDVFREFRYDWSGESIAISASIGVILLDNNSLFESEDILTLVERACQLAKEKGRNRIELIVDPEQIETIGKQQDEMRWVDRVHRALEEDRFHLYFQPIVSLDPKCDERHFELLIRMRNEANKLIAPGEFLPSVEKYHLSTKIDKWVIQTTFSWLDAYSDVLDNNTSWGINLSGQSIADTSLLETVMHEFERKDVSPENIYFEVTETAVIANLGHAIKFIETLKGIGCRFALDDFGSGLSSFAYLKNLPVDYIKIDGIFIKHILQSNIDLTMVTAIKDVSNAMGKQTVGEFVESEDIMNKLREIGVDFAQGYGIDKPRPLTEFAKIYNII